MRELAKVGFNQSYTYFTWKTARWEIADYVQELAEVDADYLRPNFFANTPDILTEQLQHGGPPAFASRLVLAATLSPSYGIYSGYEAFESRAVRPGSEEYLDSEKYQVRDRRLDGPLLPLVADLNRIRREQPALAHLGPVEFLDAKNDQLLAFAKRHDERTVIVVANLDPHEAQAGAVWVPGSLGLADRFTAHDLLTGARYEWSTGDNYVRLEPGLRPAHILAVEP
jgi:starch synthase (maltosyl-transferring)